MPYLTYDEYRSFGFAEMEESEFNRLLPKASDVLDSVTRSFYKFNSLEDDKSEWRRTQFKKAVAAQIEYFHEIGATNSHGMEQPQSVTIGRTSMSFGSNSSNSSSQNALICKDVFFYLKDTGLLYCGLGVV